MAKEYAVRYDGGKEFLSNLSGGGSDKLKWTQTQENVLKFPSVKEALHFLLKAMTNEYNRCWAEHMAIVEIETVPATFKVVEL